MAKFSELKDGELFNIDSIGAEGLLFKVVRGTDRMKNAVDAQGAHWYFSGQHPVRKVNNG